MAEKPVAETSHSEEAFAEWESDGWRPPKGVRRVGSNFDEIRLTVDSRKNPVLGSKVTGTDGERRVVPKNRNNLRNVDRDLLASAAELEGLDCVIPPPGRPRGGIGRRAAWWIANRPPEVSLSEAVERARRQMNWELTDSVLREFYRQGGDRLRGQPAP